MLECNVSSKNYFPIKKWKRKKGENSKRSIVIDSVIFEKVVT